MRKTVRASRRKRERMLRLKGKGMMAKRKK